MTVAELIAALQKMPQHVDVGYVYDGRIRAVVERVWQPQGPNSRSMPDWRRKIGVALGDVDSEHGRVVVYPKEDASLYDA